jgi:hypothetical protein
MTLENMLRGSGDLGAMTDQAYGIRKDMNLYANGSGPMEIDFVSLKDREQIGGLTQIRLAASYKQKKIDEGVVQVTFPRSYIDETGNFHVVSDAESIRREVNSIQTAVTADPTLSAAAYAELLNITTYRVEQELKRLGYHRVKGGPGGASPWHKDVGGVCPFEKKDVVEVKPKKQTFDMGMPEVITGLKALLAGAPNGEYVPEPDVLAWADQKGIPESQLNKARRRLGVVVDKDANHVKTWELPDDPAQGF